MSEVSKKVAEMLLSTESIAVYKDKPFVFVSGRISPVYIDCRKLLSFSAERMRGQMRGQANLIDLFRRRPHSQAVAERFHYATQLWIFSPTPRFANYKIARRFA